MEPFRHYQFGERRVNRDGCVEVEAAYYSVPPGWIGRTVNVQWDGRVVRVLDPRSGQLWREHLHQQRGGYRIPEEDKPAKTPRSTTQLLARCAKIGLPANPYQFVRHWLERRTPLTLRQVDPIIRQLTLYRDLIDRKTQENQE